MFALAGLCFLSLSARPGDGCKEACLQYVTDARLRAVVCGRCFTEADRGSWAAVLGDQPQVTTANIEKVLTDSDWAVRWGAVRGLAKRKAVTDGRVLTDWVTSVPDKACSTAVHVAGAKKQLIAALIHPAAAALCWERRAAIINELELELYAEAQPVRLEAVAHLAAFLERPMTRVVLDAMKSRAPQTDDLSATLLLEASQLGCSPAGKALLDVKKGSGDEPLAQPRARDLGEAHRREAPRAAVTRQGRAPRGDRNAGRAGSAVGRRARVGVERRGPGEPPRGSERPRARRR